MMYTKALCPALVVLWAGRGWAGLGFPVGSPLLLHEEEAPSCSGGGVWQPRAEGRAAATMGPVGRRGTGIS